ncbi:GNAT family N-acetyltransferase [Nonomuraea sp. WAC 01424]|uniref:GNAT family N-acetyltransferase n=1 Tax=Nonomuraea sp. WAC 01424 TaxID=2203200 RepID=UPI00289FC83E|nr:GNAT family N-acetyltransferase [Nonomuraea sp. WAC 01424]
MTESLRLVPVTPANIEMAIAVKVGPEQEHFVSPVVKSLAEAYVHPNVAWPRIILDGDGPVGFVMAFLDLDWDGRGVDFRSGLWRLNITPDAQGRGVGRFAVESVAGEIRRRGGTRMYVTWEPGSGRSGRLLPEARVSAHGREKRRRDGRRTGRDHTARARARRGPVRGLSVRGADQPSIDTLVDLRRPREAHRCTRHRR